MGKIGLFFKKVDGIGYIFIDVDKDNTIWEIKHKLYDRLEYSPPWIYLTWNGKSLNDSHTLKFYGVQKGDTIHICGRIIPTMAIHVHQNQTEIDSEFLERRWYDTVDDIKKELLEKYGKSVENKEILIKEKNDNSVNYLNDNLNIPEYLKQKYSENTNILVFNFDCYIKN